MWPFQPTPPPPFATFVPIAAAAVGAFLGSIVAAFISHALQARRDDRQRSEQRKDDDVEWERRKDTMTAQFTHELNLKIVEIEERNKAAIRAMFTRGLDAPAAAIQALAELQGLADLLGGWRSDEARKKGKG